ncbi:MAG: ATP-binding cassette domain-containing protein [Methylacidiphilales bacterium]|nr:ATP-binding cassette domain-containing protein [Candidatus Methylacidiphilales bacterium]
MRDIYLQVEGKQVGPLPEDQVKELFAKGQIQADALAWHDGLPEWVPFANLIGLSVGSPAERIPHEASSGNLVQIDGVKKSFGDKIALKNVSFFVPSGQICGLLGPNGAGKTTLFRLLMGILKATEGKLLIDGHDAFEERVEVKRLIGFLPDEPVFYSYLSGREILELSAAMHGLDVRATMDRLVPVIARLRLAEDINNYAEDYSRGMKKKLGLLLAMLHEPKLLVLDEPTNGLDVESTHLFYDLILDEAKQGTTVLFSTHLMDHVTKLCSHAIIINEGAVVAKGSLEELRARFDQASLEDIFLKLTVRPPQT